MDIMSNKDMIKACGLQVCIQVIKQRMSIQIIMGKHQSLGSYQHVSSI